MRRVATHPIWMLGNYEKKLEDGVCKVECKACKSVGITKYYSSVTTNMETHLRTQHAHLYEKMQLMQIEIKNQGRRIIAESQRKEATPGM